MRALSQLALASWLAFASIAMAQDTKNVLVIYGDNAELPYTTLFDASLRSTVRDLTPRRVEFYSEYFDVARFPSPAHREAFLQLVRTRYADRKIDVVVLGGSTAFDFLESKKEKLLPDVQFVYSMLPPNRSVTGPLPAGMVGVPVDRSPLPTIELALRLHPNAKRLVLVTGAGEWDIAWETRLRDDTARLRPRLELEFLSRLPAAEVFARLGALPKDTIVFTPGFLRDGAGAVYIAANTAGAMAVKSTAPLYVAYDTAVGGGAVGGVIPTFDAIGRQTGEIVAALLNGKQPAELKLPRVLQGATLVDWRQIRRWGIDESLLPPNAVIKFRELTVWDKYGREISIGIVILVLQGALIIALLLQRRIRQRTTANLDESEQRMNLVADAASLGVWIRDLVRNRIWASDQWRTLFGIATSEPLEFNRILQRVHPDDREAVERTLANALAGDGRYETDYRIVLADGQVRWIGSRGRAEFDRNGTPILVRGVSIDITARKSAELQIEQQRNELAHVTRVSTMGQLASTLAHELNQPLGAILRNAEAAELFLQGPSPDLDELRAILADIRKDDQRAGEVIERMRALMKRREPERSRLDLNLLAGDVVGLVQPDAGRRRVLLALETDAAVPQLFGDRVQLQQVLLNLLLNAMDALDDKPPAGRLVTLRVRRAGATIEVSVGDTGRGIPADQLLRVFDPFFTSKPNGLGLGLAISHDIIKAHGGRLWAENNAAGGATFIFTLPVAEGGDGK